MTITDLVKKIDSLGVHYLGEQSQHQEPQECMGKLESLLEGRLPGEYREFLLHYVGAFMCDEYVCFHFNEVPPWADAEGMMSLDVFYGFTKGVYGLIQNIEIFFGRIPATIIPIGDTPFGSQVCLGISGDERGKVYFWDKDDEREIAGDRENDFGNVYLIANSFSEFVESLFVAEDEPIDPAEYEDDGESWILEDY